MRFALLFVAGCSAVEAAPAAPPPVAVNPIALAPVAMDGPYKTLMQACVHAKPCGFTDLNEKGIESVPQKKTTCPSLAGDDDYDPNAGLAGGTALSHKSKDLQMRIGSQSCAVPKGIRGEQDIYYMFVKRADGWWRSERLWQWSYNDKYAGGTMLIKWNDKPGRSFAGVMAGQYDTACNRQGTTLSALEMMIRVEPGTTSPIVYAPLVVGERSNLELNDPKDINNESMFDCKPTSHADEMTEKWTGDDDLELSGIGTWNGIPFSDGMFTATAPSTAGHYRFTRP
jgi:hypothetical protein